MSKYSQLKELKEQLESREYLVDYLIDKWDMQETYQFDKANYIRIVNMGDNSLTHKTIKILKNLDRFNLEYILDRMSVENIYKPITNLVRKFLREQDYTGLAVYPASYGFGLDAFGRRDKFEQRDKDIRALLEKYGLKYTVEYSDAGWVFRYKLSKSRENIEKLKSIK